MPAIRRPCQTCGRPTDANRCPRCAGGAHRLPRPCAECGIPIDTGDYCKAHDRPHYKGPHRRRAAKIVATANALGARALCAICGKGPRPGDPWQAHHVKPGDPRSRLAPAHRSCNAALGNRVKS